mmetsp:Transcript_61507/g.121719  ORF Transcript_61507/g.121719 Transcript_61507/m.121719 type:complete len:334 (-) Transcript_61507:34-1035(-)
MPECIVVSCCSCSIHQAIQVNKKGKFACKLCGTTQSVRTVLASGTAGRDLRNMVQELNMQLRNRDEARQEARRLASTCPPQFNGEQEARDVEPSGDSRWERFCVHSDGNSALGSEKETLADSMDFSHAFPEPIPHRGGLKRNAQGEATPRQARQCQQDTERKEEEGRGRDEEAVTAWWGRQVASPQQGNWVKLDSGGHDTARRNNDMEEAGYRGTGEGGGGGGDREGEEGGKGGGRGRGEKDSNANPLSFTSAWVPLDDKCDVQLFAQRSCGADSHVEARRVAAACSINPMETGGSETRIGHSVADLGAIKSVALRETRSAPSAGKWARFAPS